VLKEYYKTVNKNVRKFRYEPLKFANKLITIYKGVIITRKFAILVRNLKRKKIIIGIIGLPKKVEA